MFRKVLTLVVLCLLCFLCMGAEVRLMWDENSEPDLAGYRLRVYTNGVIAYVVGVGLVPTVTVSNLSVGTYSFDVTAYNTAGLESPPSNMIQYSVSNAMAQVADYRLGTNRLAQ